MPKIHARSAPVLILALLLGACGSPAAAPTAAPSVDIAATQTVVAAANSNGVATSVAATLTAQPTSTPLPSNTPLPTATTEPSNTPLPTASATTAATATLAPSATVAPTATHKPTARPTLPPQPTATKAPVVAASVYSTSSGGPHGYHSTLGCTVPGGAQCQPVMAPGDVAFSIRLESDLDAVLAIFVPFGLSVEKDGANQADAYMTVVSGWLNPGEYALLGTSHNFNQPGHYVIHTNGCLLTQASYPNCSWGTVDGTVVTFDIQ